MRLRPADPPAPSLALVAGIALCATLRGWGGDGLALKWPNDVMAGDAKIAGILLERRGDAVVCGFGANLAHDPDLPDRPTTSLAALTEAAPDAHDVASALADRFADTLALWRAAGLAAILEAWRALAHPVGTPLAATLPDGTRLTGRFAGLDATGALRLATGASERTVHAGDVLAIPGATA